MKRSAIVSTSAFLLCFAAAVLLLISADRKLDERTAALRESHCARQVPVPAFAAVASWSAVALLIVAAAAAVVFIASAARFSSAAVKIPAIVVAVPAAILAAGYALVVGFALLQPNSDEPISPRYHPCEAFFRQGSP